MKKAYLLSAILGLCAASAAAQYTQPLDSVPSRALVLSGDASHPAQLHNIAELYSRLNLAFEDPAAPRFLFLDKKGEVALGIGGYVKATGMYDFMGAIDNNGFVTNEIPVPLNPARRNRFGATANHSTIFLKLVTSPTKFGRVIVYVQTNFTGDNGGYGLKMKQAYVTVGHVTAGLARSTFSDAPAMAPTVDDQGPSGQVTAKQMLVQYISPSYGGFSYALSAELPSASYTLAAGTEAISQRCPDIPAYIQYAWNKGASHVRVSGLLRQLSYRDVISGHNHFATGWGVQFSAIAQLGAGFSFFGHYTYGKGIGHYINDFDGEGLDLVPDYNEPGKLKAPGMAGLTAGLQYDITKDLFVSASYSRAQLYNAGGISEDTERYSQYIAANMFYNVWGDLRFGLEYVHGTRKDLSGLSGKASRIEAMLQYSF